MLFHMRQTMLHDVRSKAVKRSKEKQEKQKLKRMVYVEAMNKVFTQVAI